MKYDVNKIQDGLMAYRSIDRDLLVEKDFRILKDKYGQEAYYFNMNELEFITYGKGVEDKVFSKNFKDYFESKFDNEYALRPETYRRNVNENFTYRELNNTDSLLLSNFKKQFNEGELEQGAVSIDDPLVIGAFDREKLIGVASTWEWKNDLVDIGLIVDLGYRGQGVGSSVVSVIIDSVIDSKICIYRADYENIGSIKIAERLGFERISKIYRLKK